MFPSHFGSHKSMIDEEATKAAGDGVVVCVDEFGPYTTTPSYLDSGEADPNRNKTSRLTKLFGRKEKS